MPRSGGFSQGGFPLGGILGSQGGSFDPRLADKHLEFDQFVTFKLHRATKQCYNDQPIGPRTTSLWTIRFKIPYLVPIDRAPTFTLYLGLLQRVTPSVHRKVMSLPPAGEKWLMLLNDILTLIYGEKGALGKYGLKTTGLLCTPCVVWRPRYVCRADIVYSMLSHVRTPPSLPTLPFH